MQFHSKLFSKSLLGSFEETWYNLEYLWNTKNNFCCVLSRQLPFPCFRARQRLIPIWSWKENIMILKFFATLIDSDNKWNHSLQIDYIKAMLLWENRKNTLFIFCEGYKSSCKVSNRNIFEFHTVVRNELLKYFRVGFNVRKLKLIKYWWKIHNILILPFSYTKGFLKVLIKQKFENRS